MPQSENELNRLLETGNAFLNSIDELVISKEKQAAVEAWQKSILMLGLEIKGRQKAEDLVALIKQIRSAIDDKKQQIKTELLSAKRSGKTAQAYLRHAK